MTKPVTLEEIARYDAYQCLKRRFPSVKTRRPHFEQWGDIQVEDGVRKIDGKFVPVLTFHVPVPASRVEEFMEMINDNDFREVR